MKWSEVQWMPMEGEQDYFYNSLLYFVSRYAAFSDSNSRSVYAMWIAISAFYMLKWKLHTVCPWYVLFSSGLLVQRALCIWSYTCVRGLYKVPAKPQRFRQCIYDGCFPFFCRHNRRTQKWAALQGQTLGKYAHMSLKQDKSRSITWEQLLEVSVVGCTNIKAIQLTITS